MIDHFHIGDTIETVNKHGIRIAVTITDVRFFPMGEKIDILIYFHHEPSGKNNSISLPNLESWLREAKWKLRE